MCVCVENIRVSHQRQQTTVIERSRMQIADFAQCLLLFELACSKDELRLKCTLHDCIHIHIHTLVLTYIPCGIRAYNVCACACVCVSAQC